ncbi:hypothetical protein F0U61_38985 [Archangium violaceum]|uniref:hypothetical protein n=1 Tax=Archangium violaceum TaxID=83451 RepID=UPI002B284025|nr:hypothetical protein F0U61_38985 [Archangium violaceum]
MNMHELLPKVRELLVRLRTTASSEEKELLAVAYFALDFIEVTGNFYPFEAFLQSWNSPDGTLPTVASFGSLAEAETWLKEHPEPPHGAYVLVSGQPYSVFHVRHLDRRLLLPAPSPGTRASE